LCISIAGSFNLFDLEINVCVNCSPERVIINCNQFDGQSCNILSALCISEAQVAQDNPNQDQLQVLAVEQVE